FAVAPAAALVGEILDQVLAPVFLAVGHAQADEVAVEAQGVKAVAVHSRGAARAVVAATVAAHGANHGLPQLLARLLAQANDVLVRVEVAPQEDAARGPAGRDEAFAQLGRLPNQLRTLFGPALEQRRFLGDGGALRALPLRPIVLARVEIIGGARHGQRAADHNRKGPGPCGEHENGSLNRTQWDHQGGKVRWDRRASLLEMYRHMQCRTSANRAACLPCPRLGEYTTGSPHQEPPFRLKSPNF